MLLAQLLELFPLEKFLGRSKAKKASFLTRIAEPIIFVNYSLPAVLKDLLNKILEIIPGYQGSVEKVKLHPLQGRLVIQGLHFEKKITREKAEPLLKVEEMSLNFHWRSLLAGVFIADVEITRPIVDWDARVWPPEKSDPARERRKALEPSWVYKLQKAPPVRIGRVRVQHGEVRVHDVAGQGSDDLYMQDIFAVAKNITNTSSSGRILPASLECRAQVNSTGHLRLTATGFPFSQPPEFEAALDMKDVALIDFKSLIEHHLGLTILSGTLDVQGEGVTQEGAFRGHVTSVVENLRIETTPHQSLRHRIKAYIAERVTTLLRNKRTDRIATRIKLNGSLQDPDIDVLSAVQNFVMNVFMKSFSDILKHPFRYFWHEGPRVISYPAPDTGGRKFFPMLKKAFQNWRANEAPQMAASLSYYTSFSLAPLLLLVIAVAGLVFGRDAVEGHVFKQLAGLVGSQSADAIQSMIASAWQPGKSVLAIMLGLVSLIAGATGVLSALKDGLNRVWKAKEEGSLEHIVRERAKFLGLILGIGFLLMVSLAVSAAIAALGKFLAGYLPFLEALEHGLDLMISMSVITSLFVMIFKYIPDAIIPRRALWAGSAFTALLFTLGKFALGLYLGKGVVGSSYGTAGAVLIILLWVYYSGLILYFGAEFTKVFADSLEERDAELVIKD